MYFFEYLKYPTEIITLVFVTFFVLILITPITTVAELQYRSWEAVARLVIITSCQFNVVDVIVVAFRKE